MKPALLLAALGSIAALAASCGEDSSPSSEEPDAANPGAIGQQVPWPTEQWTIKPPAELGMDSKLIDEALDYAFENINPPSMRNPGDPDRFPFDTLTQGVVVIRGGALVAERYAPHPDPTKGGPRDASSWAASWSAAKSFTSTLIGILMDQGKIPNVDVPLSTFPPFAAWANDARASITLRDVLQMSSGLKFSEAYTDIGCLSNPEAGSECAEFLDMAFAADQTAYMLERPTDPGRTRGQTWYYSSGDTQLLAGLVAHLSGKSTVDFAKEVLLDPIGMTREPFNWWEDPSGNTLGYCCIDTTTRNFAKFGLLFLREGEWDGRQVVSKEWVRQATTDASAGNSHYAYQWWLTGQKIGTTLPADAYAAEGQNEQRIWVIPSLDLVVVRNSYYNKNPGEDGILGTADDAKIENNLISEFLIDGMTEYGTDTGAFFLECAFLAPIINSIEGAPKIETCNDAGGGDPNNPQPIFACREEGKSCRERAMERYTPYCEEFQGALCDVPDLANKFMTCDDNCGCREILDCAFRTQCFVSAAFDCLNPCQDVIDQNGGVSGVPGTLVVDVALALDAAAAAGQLSKTCP
jgi:CubicO group peptidase (beta-lactamase class C family)